MAYKVKIKFKIILFFRINLNQNLDFRRLFLIELILKYWNNPNPNNFQTTMKNIQVFSEFSDLPINNRSFAFSIVLFAFSMLFLVVNLVTTLISREFRLSNCKN